ncbi:MAG: YlxR family protein [Armatimonadota bacterium]
MKHTPIRRCASCRRTAPKSALIRFARQKDPETGAWQVQLDPHQKLPGRGAYLCPQVACVQHALKKQALAKVLHAPVPRELLEQVLTSISVSNIVNPQSDNRTVHRVNPGHSRL